MMFANIWGFPITLQGNHIYNLLCKISLAEKCMLKQEIVLEEPPSSSVQMQESTNIR